MAAKKQKKTETEETVTIPESSKPEASPAQKKELLAFYRQAQQRVTEAEQALEQAELSMSDAIRGIQQGVGSGPYIIDGKTVTIIARKNKSKDIVTYFFKSVGAEIQELG